jgi:hypothetical protein
MKKKITFLFAMLAAFVTTAMADNVISADPLTITQNGTAELTINLKNSEVVRGLQFTLTLPEGVTVEASEVGIPGQDYKPANNVKVTTITGTTDNITGTTENWWALGNNVSTTEKPRTYKFVMLDPNGEGLATSESARAILKISFAAAADATLAETSVAITDIHMSIAGSTADATQADTQASVTVSDVVKGDVNNDTKIDITDAVLILRHIVQKPNETFIEAAADVNSDTKVDITDVVLILQYIVHKIDAFSREGAAEETNWDFYDPE